MALKISKVSEFSPDRMKRGQGGILHASTYHPGTVVASSHLSEVGLTAKPAGQRWRRG